MPVRITHIDTEVGGANPSRAIVTLIDAETAYTVQSMELVTLIDMEVGISLQETLTRFISQTAVIG